MRGHFKPVLLLLLGFALVLVLSFLTRPHELVKWQTDFTAASAEARRAGKPMLVDFTADWCGACDQMRRTTWSDPAVAKMLRNYIAVQVNVDAHQDLASRYHIQYLPTIALMDSEGTVLKAVDGALTPESLLAWLNGDSQPGDGRRADVESLCGIRMGICRTRTPIASKTALAMAGAIAMMGVSPAPAECSSRRSSR